MFVVNDDLSIYATRGDVVAFSVSADDNGKDYLFQAGDVLRIKVYGKKDAENVVLEKDFPVTEETPKVDIFLTEQDTKIGEVISKPTDYWYEIELNPFNNPQTIIGYDEDGAKVFKLFPEGKDEHEYDPNDGIAVIDDCPDVDDELSLTSVSPVQNQAVARAFINLAADVEDTRKETAAKVNAVLSTVERNKNAIAVERARVDSMVAGKTADSAEVVDVRIGADGTTYGSAGTAVREQITRLHTLLTNGNYVPIEKNSPLLTNIADHYVNGVRGVTALEGYTISHFDTAEATQMYFEVVGDIEYLTLCVFNGGMSGNVTEVYRDETLPLKDSPVVIGKGMTVAISHRDTDFKLCHNSQFLGFEASYQFNLNGKIKNELSEPITALTEALTDRDSFLGATPEHPIFTYVNGYVDKDGNLTVDVNNPYETHYFTADRDFALYFDKTSSYLSLAVFGGALGELFQARYRYYQTENTLPYEPYQVKRGQTIAITCNVGGWFKVWANNNLFGVQLKDSVYLSEARMHSVATPERRNFFRYEKSNGASYSTERIFIYIPTYIGYVGYEFAHVVNATINANNWRIIRAFSCGNNFEERFNITNNGEWEMAIMIDGRSDFIGGSLHGDEVLNGIAFIVDGVKKTINDMTELTAFDTLRIVENTTMYDPADNVTAVATHGKEYVFTAEGLTLKQFVNWTTVQNIATSYMTMLPILRGNDAYSALQVSDTYYADNDFLEYNIATPEKTAAFAYKKDVRHVTIYSNKSGVCASVDVVKTPNTVGGGWFQISDAATYNKVYFTCAGYINDHTTQKGERWETETKYKLSVNNGTDV